jgi:hypothetical protein
MTPTTHPVIATHTASTSGDITAQPPAPTDTPFSTALEALTGVSPVLATVYLVTRLLIPAVLITIITRTASAEQRIVLLRDYLHHGDDRVPR